MEVLFALSMICAIIFLGFFSELIFKKFNIPDVLLLIFVGIGLSSVFKILSPENFLSGADLFTTFALIFILFTGAITIEFSMLLKSLFSTLKLTLLNFFLTVIVTCLISLGLGYDILLSLLIGMILGGTSSAVVIPLVNNVQIKNKYGLVLTLESAISDVLCIVGTLTILEIIETGNLVASDIFRGILISFSLAIIIGTLLGFVWAFLIKKFNVLLNSYMLTIAFLIMVFVFVESEFVRASGAIAVLAFGLVIGNSKGIFSFTSKNFNNEKKVGKASAEDLLVVKKGKNVGISAVLNHSAKNFYSEISFFVKTFFFVYLGILIDFSNPMVFLYGFLLTLGIYLIRPLSVKIAFSGEKMAIKERAFLEVLIPKGLAAAVLAGISVQSGVLGDSASVFVNTILSVVLLSILSTSILVFLTEKGWFSGIYGFWTKK